MENCIICGNKDFVKFMTKEKHSYFRCTKCKIEFIFPQPDKNVLENIYTREYHDRWKNKISEASFLNQKKKTFEFRLNDLPFNIPQKAAILDCGCSTGYFLQLLNDRGYCPYGIDVSEYAAEKCRKKFGDNKIYCGNLEFAEFNIGRENIFDFIFMSDYLEHVVDPAAVITKAYSLLKPEGRLVIYTPDTSSWLKKILGKRWPHYKTEHLFYFNTHNLIKLFEQICFFDSIRYKNFKFISFDYMFCYFNEYPNPFLKTPIKVIRFFLPGKFKSKLFKFALSEMTIICRKPK